MLHLCTHLLVETMLLHYYILDVINTLKRTDIKTIKYYLTLEFILIQLDMVALNHKDKKFQCRQENHRSRLSCSLHISLISTQIYTTILVILNNNMELIIDAKTANTQFIGANTVTFINVNGLNINNKCTM